MGKPAQVLVTGGTGFIGRHLVRRLLKDNISVRLLSRSRTKAESLFGRDVEIAEGDLVDTEKVRKACVGIDRIYHTGGIYLFGAGHRRDLMAANVGGTENILSAAWKENVSRVVHLSSAGILERKGTLVSESDFPDHPAPGSHYKSSKWMAEQCALKWAERGLPVMIANPSCPIGAEDERPTPTGRMILDFIRRQFPFASHTGLNFIAVEDLADGIVAVGEKGRPGHRYLMGHHNLWLTDFLQLLSQLTGLNRPKVTVPWPVIAAAGLVGEAAGRVHPRWGNRVCWETAFFAKKIQFLDLTKSREELGWSPQTPVEVGARRAIDWFYKMGLAQPLSS